MGGLENGLINLINHLPRDRFRHAIACIEDFSEFRTRIQRDDVEVFALHRSQIGASGVRREIYRICRRLRPALVHSRNQSGLDALLPARLAGVRSSVHSEHGWDVDNLEGRHWKPRLLRRLHAPLVDEYITVSKDLQRFLTERVGIAPKRVTQIYNGVDVVRFAPAPALPALTLPVGFESDCRVRIGTVGRIQPVKDHATLLHALASLVERRPDLRSVARLILVGDGPLREDISRQAETLGIADIVWLSGATNRVADMLRTLDVFVLPSLNEGISNTMLEAMASGLPVVASAVGGNLELVEDGVTGSLFTAQDSSGLADLLERYLTDADLRRRHGVAAREAAESRFSLTTMIANYGVLYERLCSQGHG
ncbi:MAG: TIGR03088 family PEP-CTERM/XrtA system glycosyltransferase [Rhizobacter sp.]|nr:TIGR03088 family PEP-CTERM/XrtA system glycosyltransferase [Rhizobacter sp.]